MRITTFPVFIRRCSSIKYDATVCDWLVLSSCDWCISIVTVPSEHISINSAKNSIMVTKGRTFKENKATPHMAQRSATKHAKTENCVIKLQFSATAR